MTVRFCYSDDVGFPCAPTRPVQAEVRSDLTPTLQQASSVYLPTQNMYKHSKEFARKPSASGQDLLPTQQECSSWAVHLTNQTTLEGV